MRSLPNQATLEFGKRSKHMENQLSRRTTCFDFFCQTFKTDATLLKIIHDMNKVG